MPDMLVKRPSWTQLAKLLSNIYYTKIDCQNTYKATRNVVRQYYKMSISSRRKLYLCDLFTCNNKQNLSLKNNEGIIK